jgi:hypothetical protein
VDSIAARYRRWNLDRAVEYAMSSTKGDDTGGKEGASGGGVIQRVIHEVGGGSSYPTLTKINYSDWALLMMVKLKARGLWSAVEPGGGDEQEDMMALDILSNAVPTEMVSSVASKETTKEAWEAIKTMRVGDDRVRASTAQTLLRQFETAKFKDGESVEDYSLRLVGMVQHLATLGETLEEAKVVGKFLRSMPAKYRQIVLAIQTLLPVDTLTLADVTGRLKAAEEEFEAPPPTVNHAGKLYLSEEAWEEKWKLRASAIGGGSGGRGGGSDRGRGGRRGRGRGNGRSRSGSGGPNSSAPGPGKLHPDQCRTCGKMGHWGNECRSKPKKDAAYTAQEEEETLVYLRASPQIEQSEPAERGAAPVAPRHPGAGCDGGGPSGEMV